MRLNLGSGGRTDDGWVHLDREFSPETLERAEAQLRARPSLPPRCDSAFVQHDLREPLPFKDGEVTMAAAHHVLDLLDHDALALLVGEVFRVLEPGGVLRVSSVDYRHAIGALARGDFAWFTDLGVPECETIERTFAWYLDWGGARKTIFYAPEHLAVEYLHPAGFGVDLLSFHETLAQASICDLDSREGESWFLEARKPA